MQNHISDLSPETLSEKILEALNNGKNLESIRQQYIQDGGSQLTWLRALKILHQELTDDTNEISSAEVPKVQKNNGFWGKIALNIFAFSIFTFVVCLTLPYFFYKIDYEIDLIYVIILCIIIFIVPALLCIGLILTLFAFAKDKCKTNAYIATSLLVLILLLFIFYGRHYIGALFAGINIQ